MASSIVLDIVREDYELLFSHLKAPEPREGLLDVILERVEKERATQILKRRLRLSISASAVSLAAFIPVFNVFGGWVRSSGFSEFASFLFLKCCAISSAFSTNDFCRTILPYFAAKSKKTRPIFSEYVYNM